MELKTGIDGLKLQSVHGHEMWMSPVRDIVYAYNTYMHKALLLASNTNNQIVANYYLEGGSTEEIEEYTQKLIQFAKAATAEDREDGALVGAVVKDIGLEDSPERVRKLIGYCMLCVVMGAYWSGTGESRACTRVEQLRTFYAPVGYKDKGFKGFVRNILRRLYRLFS